MCDDEKYVIIFLFYVAFSFVIVFTFLIYYNNAQVLSKR